MMSVSALNSSGGCRATAPTALSRRSAAAQPKPRILGKACFDLAIIRGLDDVQGLLSVADWSAEDDKAIIDKPVHECSVLIPGILVPDLT
jgi:hypothetical protein